MMLKMHDRLYKLDCRILLDIRMNEFVGRGSTYKGIRDGFVHRTKAVADSTSQFTSPIKAFGDGFRLAGTLRADTVVFMVVLDNVGFFFWKRETLDLVDTIVEAVEAEIAEADARFAAMEVHES